MLEIKNIEKLRNTEIAGWKIREAYAEEHRHYMYNPHYLITFVRGPYGAAMVIDRTINPFLKSYNLKIYFDKFTNVIYECAMPLAGISNKDRLLNFCMDTLNREYNKKRK
jgi:hypothetical protein